MSLAIIHTRAQVGIDAPAVTIEVHLSGGLPSLSIVGLAEKAVNESKERVRSALLNAGFDFPARRITVNMAPADLPKEGGRFDLAIAVGIMVASGQLPAEPLQTLELLGELALSGQLRAVRGVLPAALACREAGRQLLLPLDNGAEAALARGLEVLPAADLLGVALHLRGEQRLPSCEAAGYDPERASPLPELSDVKGQPQAKRALEIAAAGGHNLLFSGVPGSGKSMLAHRLQGLLPPLTEQELLEVAAIHSVAGLIGSDQLPQSRPYRAPHHSASAAAMVGGGSQPRPGEISLAHFGVLFLDELPEFNRQVLEVLREPLETGEILIARAARRTQFPARFQLVAAMNPCPCGFYGEPDNRCRCSPDQVRRYQGRISGPLLDRIDLQLRVPAPTRAELLADHADGETSFQVRQRVAAARKRQLARQGCANHALAGPELEQACGLSEADRHMLLDAIERLRLSARAYHRLMRVARTIADLAGEDRVGQPQLLEALSYRGGLGLPG
ncbi:YifB family Mg chelatase-like AAA ATPase [Marinobacterium arenosum]|uniref:YifB family Mg chelatase-like AAA ATPase n=1 Tax=Marinobacterium arenosum TaxID=2862496 RepID=UPI001C94C054|nr:YifB family Mg chelatase-like AAA ATPase [Marinobacterium arenosum]MBY4676487.1 YifB family Mg chelatase-like AAA ATPase [Marinobacterium arenosum]